MLNDELIGEGMLHVMRHALGELAVPKPCIIPAKVSATTTTTERLQTVSTAMHLLLCLSRSQYSVASFVCQAKIYVVPIEFTCFNKRWLDSFGAILEPAKLCATDDMKSQLKTLSAVSCIQH